MKEGIYISRIDGDCVTYDLRFCRPNCGILLDNATLHTVEHMLATFLRNSEYSSDVVYFGPMGCQTGFYLIVRNTLTSDKVLAHVRDILQKTLDFEGDVPGASEEQCGNYRNLDLQLAKKACRVYLDKIKNVTEIIDYDAINAM